MSHGPVMLDLRGLELEQAERELLAHPATGGVILFARNHESVEQVTRLIDEVHEVRSPKLLIAVDQEGGRVQRFQDGFTRLPPGAWYAQQYELGREHGTHAAREAGWLMAAELRACGVDFSFAPVLDVEQGISRVIGNRAFGDTPAIVADLAEAWMHGARQAGMPSVGKHFPGHGAVAADSHLDLPVDERPLSEIQSWDMQPFRRLIEDGLDGIMPAHVVYPQVDAHAAGFSERWLQHILRAELDFQGVIFSDDLTMAAAESAGSYTDRAEAALAAGCDMLLVCNNQDAAAQVLDLIGDETDPVRQSRLARMHGRGHMDFRQLHSDQRWRQAVELLARAEQPEQLDL